MKWERGRIDVEVHIGDEVWHATFTSQPGWYPIAGVATAAGLLAVSAYLVTGPAPATSKQPATLAAQLPAASSLELLASPGDGNPSDPPAHPVGVGPTVPPHPDDTGPSDETDPTEPPPESTATSTPDATSTTSPTPTAPPTTGTTAPPTTGTTAPPTTGSTASPTTTVGPSVTVTTQRPWPSSTTTVPATTSSSVQEDPGDGETDPADGLLNVGVEDGKVTITTPIVEITLDEEEVSDIVDVLPFPGLFS